MSTIQLGYGRVTIQFEYDPARFEILQSRERSHRSLTDAEISLALDDPIDSSPLDQVIESGDTVLIVASDATRGVPKSLIYWCGA